MKENYEIKKSVNYRDFTEAELASTAILESEWLKSGSTMNSPVYM